MADAEQFDDASAPIDRQAAVRKPDRPETEMPSSLTEDAFLGGRVSILQPERGYRAGIDAVFLAAAIPIEPGQTAFEAGCGVGVVSLCIAARVADVHLTGMEVMPHHSAVAEENVKRNGFNDNIRIVTGDVKEATRKDLTRRLQAESFDHVFANPPFFDEDKVRKSPVDMRNSARTFGPEDLEAWVGVMAALAVPRGTVTVVHRAESLGRLLAAFGTARVGAIHVAPLHPREGCPASRVIVQGIKGSRAPMQVLHGLVLHDRTNAFTPAASAVLRDGAAHAMR